MRERRSRPVTAGPIVKECLPDGLWRLRQNTAEVSILFPRKFLDDAALALPSSIASGGRTGVHLMTSGAGQPVKHVFWMVPLFGPPSPVHKSFVDGVPQLVGAKLVKLGEKAVFDPKSLRIS